MNRSEVVKRCNILYGKIDVLVVNMESLLVEVKEVLQYAEYELPSEEDDIDKEG